MLADTEGLAMSTLREIESHKAAALPEYVRARSGCGWKSPSGVGTPSTLCSRQLGHADAPASEGSRQRAAKLPGSAHGLATSPAGARPDPW